MALLFNVVLMGLIWAYGILDWVYMYGISSGATSTGD